MAIIFPDPRKFKDFPYSWQYNGVALWQDVWDWCVDHISLDDFETNWETIYFKNKNDYTFFLLKWT
jgi:hypothetical protein